VIWQRGAKREPKRDGVRPPTSADSKSSGDLHRAGKAEDTEQRRRVVKHGHVVGTCKVTGKEQSWYDAIQAEHLARIEREWQEREAAKQQAGK
jgi:hypothetical protein